MKIEKLREIIKKEIELLTEEITNLPEKEVFVRIEIESWIDCCEWILTEIDKNE